MENKDNSVFFDENSIALFMLEDLAELSDSIDYFSQFEVYCESRNQPELRQHDLQKKLIELFEICESRGVTQQHIIKVLTVIINHEHLTRWLANYVFIFYKFIPLNLLPVFDFNGDYKRLLSIAPLKANNLDLDFLKGPHRLAPDVSDHEYENICLNLAVLGVFFSKTTTLPKADDFSGKSGVLEILERILDSNVNQNLLVPLQLVIISALKTNHQTNEYAFVVNEKFLILLCRYNRIDLLFINKKHGRWTIFGLEGHKSGTPTSEEAINALISIDNRKISKLDRALLVTVLGSIGFIPFEQMLNAPEGMKLTIKRLFNFINDNFEHLEYLVDIPIAINNYRTGIELCVDLIENMIHYYVHHDMSIAQSSRQNKLFLDSLQILSIDSKILLLLHDESLSNIEMHFDKLQHINILMMHCSIYKLDFQRNAYDWLKEIRQGLDLNKLNTSVSDRYSGLLLHINIFLRSRFRRPNTPVETYLPLKDYKHNNSPVTHLRLLLRKTSCAEPQILQRYIDNTLWLFTRIIDDVLRPSIPFILFSEVNSKPIEFETMLSDLLFPYDISQTLKHKFFDKSRLVLTFKFLDAYQKWNPEGDSLAPFVSRLCAEMLPMEPSFDNEITDLLSISLYRVGYSKPLVIDCSDAIKKEISHAITYKGMNRFVSLLFTDYQIFPSLLSTNLSPTVIDFYYTYLGNQERYLQQSSSLQTLLEQLDSSLGFSVVQGRKNAAKYLDLLLNNQEKEMLKSGKQVRERGLLPPELAGLMMLVSELSPKAQAKLPVDMNRLQQSLADFSYDGEEVLSKVDMLTIESVQVAELIMRVLCIDDMSKANVTQEDIESAVIKNNVKALILRCVTDGKKNNEGYKRALNILLQSKQIDVVDTNITNMLLNHHSEQLNKPNIDVATRSLSLELSRLTINCIASAVPDKETSTLTGQVMAQALMIGAEDGKRSLLDMPLALKAYVASYNGTLRYLEHEPAWQSARRDGRFTLPLLENNTKNVSTVTSLHQAEKKLVAGEMFIQLYQTGDGDICSILTSKNCLTGECSSSYHQFKPMNDDENQTLTSLIHLLKEGHEHQGVSPFSAHCMTLRRLWQRDNHALLSTIWQVFNGDSIESVILLISGRLSVLPWEWLLQRDNADETSTHVHISRTISLSHFRSEEKSHERPSHGMLYIYDKEDPSVYFRHGEYQTFNRYFSTYSRALNWRHWFKRQTLNTISDVSPVDIIQGMTKASHCHIHLHAKYNDTDPRNITIQAGDYSLPLWSFSHCRDIPKRIYFSSCESGMHGMTAQSLLSPVGLAPTLIARGAEEVVAPLWKVNQLVSFVFYHLLYDIQRKTIKRPFSNDLTACVDLAKQRMQDMTLQDLAKLIRKHNPGEFELSQLKSFYEGEVNPMTTISWFNRQIIKFNAWYNARLHAQVTPVSVKDFLEVGEFSQFFWSKSILNRELMPLDSKPFASSYWWGCFVVYRK